MNALNRLLYSRSWQVCVMVAMLLIFIHFWFFVRLMPASQTRELVIPELPVFIIPEGVSPESVRAAWSVGSITTDSGFGDNTASESMNTKQLAQAELQLLATILGAKKLATVRLRSQDGIEQVLNLQLDEIVADAKLTQISLNQACFDYASQPFCLTLFPANIQQLIDNTVKGNP